MQSKLFEIVELNPIETTVIEIDIISPTLYVALIRQSEQRTLANLNGA